MFPKKVVVIIGVIVLIAVNITALSITSRRYSSSGPGRIVLTLVAPFQEAVSQTIRFTKDLWNHYFFLVSAAEENEEYKKALGLSEERSNLCNELELANTRLRGLLNFQQSVNRSVIAAEVIGRDPSPWYKTVMIDKGSDDGVSKGLAVVVPEGVVGQVMDVSDNYAKVLLIVDPNSAVDAMLQRTRARGVVKGGASGRCMFQYVLRKHDIGVGDRVVSSGLDLVFPKGLGVGYVSEVVKPNSGIFQDVTVTPFVDHEKLEEVLVVSSPPRQDAVGKK